MPLVRSVSTTWRLQYRPSRESTIRLDPGAFQRVWDDAPGPFSIDHVPSTASVQRLPRSPHALPFFSQYDCADSSGVDVLPQDVSRISGYGRASVRVLSPFARHGGTCRTALGRVSCARSYCGPGTRAYWYPLVQQAIVRSLEVVPKGMFGHFQWPYQDGTLREWRYPEWVMIADEVDFRTAGD